MFSFLKSLIAPVFIGIFVVSFIQNTANSSSAYQSNFIEDFSDTLFMKTDVIPYSEIPCDDVYKTWDNSRIHPYQFQGSRMRDTVELVMGYHSCDFHMPREGSITSNFGKRDGGYHYGIDIKLRTGNAVTAAFEGMVRISKYSGSYGNVVVVRHNNGIETLYAHLSKRKVKAGDFVQAGEVIGLGGNTGRSSGSHLHFETRYMGEPINPNKIIDFKNNVLKNDTVFLTRYNFKSSKNVLKNKKKKVAPKKVIKPKKKSTPKKKPTPTSVNPLLKKATPVKKKKSSSTTKTYHKVVKGNTVYSLARANGVTVTQIQKWNGLRNNNIKVGTKIRVK